MLRKFNNADHEVRFLFVVTYGRSGSTILTKLINTMDGFHLQGENNGTVQSLIESVRLIEEGKIKYGGRSTNSIEHPWHGIENISLNKYKKNIHDLITKSFFNVKKGTKVSGFKEIRYYLLNDDAFHYHMDFLLDFKDAKIIFNQREARKIADSAWWKERDRSDVLRMVERMNRLFASTEKRHPSRCLTTRNEDISKYEEVKRIADFCGGYIDSLTHEVVVSKLINISK